MRNLIVLLFACLFITATFVQAEVSVVITEPADNSVFQPNATVMVKMEVTATADEAIKDVRLYNQGKSKTRLRREPWEFEWKAMQTGSYALEAKVTLDDEDGTEIWTEAPVYFRCGNVDKGDRIFNGGFESGKLVPWVSQLNESGVATFNVYDDFYFDDDHYLVVEIENASTENWHIQLSQSVPLDSGHIYDVYFLADSDNKRPINVGMQEGQDPWGTQLWSEMEIDGANEYMLNFEATQTDPTNFLRFNFGGNNSTVYLDDIRVIDHNAASVKERRLDFVGAPVEYELFKAYPNPFNMNTTIQYRLSTQADVRLEIYNMSGQLVQTLTQGIQAAGTYSLKWDGLDMQSHVVPSGVYFYRLTYTADGTTSSLHQKMMLVK